MAVGDAHVFPGFLTPVLTQLFFPKPPTTFITCFCRGERRKYAGKKVRLNWGSNSQPPSHEAETFTTEPPRRSPPDHRHTQILLWLSCIVVYVLLSIAVLEINIFKGSKYLLSGKILHSKLDLLGSKILMTTDGPTSPPPPTYCSKNYCL